jgi:hypothetical protein
MPSGMKNGTRLETLDAPPANTVMDVALSRSSTFPGEVLAGMTKDT